MATIPRAVLDYVTRQVNALSADAQSRVLRVLRSIEWTPENIARCRELVVEALEMVLPTYTDAAAQAGADLYDAVRAAQVGEAMGATATSGYDRDATKGAVRALVQQIVDGKPVEQFNRSVLDRVDYEVRRAENVSVAENAARDPLHPRYARVPTGVETCEFCIMLASRGFVYTSREAASHAHASCDCRVVPGFQGATEVEGYDPDAYYELWRKSEDLKNDQVPVAQREAILAATRARLIPDVSAGPTEMAVLYQEGMRSAWADFKRLGKTADAYQATVEAYLKDVGGAVGGSFSAEFMARPGGDEIWAAARLSSRYSSVTFRYASSEHKSPDYLLDGEMAELKTPESMKKVRRRVNSIPSQFVHYPDEPVFGVVSTLYTGNQDEVVEMVTPFVEDGTLDRALVVTPDEIIEV